MKYRVVRSKSFFLGCFLSILFAAALAVPPAFHAQAAVSNGATSSAATNQSKDAPISRIPSGTILPVVLRTTFSFEKCKAGDVLHGKIAQEVPLANGSAIRKGSQVEGHIVEVTPASDGKPQQVSLRFEKVRVNGEWIPVRTNLRAIAGFMTILEAQVPDEAPGEGSPYNWLPTTQIGGDSVYGVNGPVMSAEDTSKVIGKSVYDGGVLVRPSAKEGTRCRGVVNGNEQPQALWVFSGDACGAYGIEHLEILHAGRTSPEGTMILAAAKPNLKLTSGDGLLLRVD